VPDDVHITDALRASDIGSPIPPTVVEQCADSVGVFTHGLPAVLSGLAAEAAVQGNAEVVEVPGCRGVPAT